MGRTTAGPVEDDDDERQSELLLAGIHILVTPTAPVWDTIGRTLGLGVGFLKLNLVKFGTGDGRVAF